MIQIQISRWQRLQILYAWQQCRQDYIFSQAFGADSPVMGVRTDF